MFKKGLNDLLNTIKFVLILDCNFLKKWWVEWQRQIGYWNDQNTVYKLKHHSSYWGYCTQQSISLIADKRIVPNGC